MLLVVRHGCLLTTGCPYYRQAPKGCQRNRAYPERSHKVPTLSPDASSLVFPSPSTGQALAPSPSIGGPRPQFAILHEVNESGGQVEGASCTRYSSRENAELPVFMGGVSGWLLPPDSHKCPRLEFPQSSPLLCLLGRCDVVILLEMYRGSEHTRQGNKCHEVIR